jgi:hypothetical protein
MGMIDVGIGAINWDENKFAVPSSSISGVIIKGNAVFDDGRIKRIELLHNQYKYQVVYHYDRVLELPFLPDRFEVSFLPTNGQELQYEFQLISVETATNSLPASFFDPFARDKDVLRD